MASAPVRRGGPRKRGGLKRPLDVHFGTENREYELLAREAWLAQKSLAEFIRDKCLGADPEKRLNKAQAECRKLGEPDESFMHPKERTALVKAGRNGTAG